MGIIVFFWIVLQITMHINDFWWFCFFIDLISNYCFRLLVHYHLFRTGRIIIVSVFFQTSQNFPFYQTLHPVKSLLYQSWILRVFIPYFSLRIRKSFLWLFDYPLFCSKFPGSTYQYFYPNTRKWAKTGVRYFQKWWGAIPLWTNREVTLFLTYVEVDSASAHMYFERHFWRNVDLTWFN